MSHRRTLQALACAAVVTAQYTLLSKDGLIAVPDLTNQFGPEDKLLYCMNGTYVNATNTTIPSKPMLVFVDLDELTQSNLYYSPDDGISWFNSTVVAVPCPDPSQPLAPLIPRDSGYGVAKVRGSAPCVGEHAHGRQGAVCSLLMYTPCSYPARRS